MIRKLPKRVKVIGGLLASIVFLFCGCLFCASIVPTSKTASTGEIRLTATSIDTQPADLVSTNVPATLAEPSATPEPTNTPLPTATLAPTRTTDPQVFVNQTQNAAYLLTLAAQPTATIIVASPTPTIKVLPTNTPKPLATATPLPKPTATPKKNPTATQKANNPPPGSGTFTVTKLTSPIDRGKKATLTIKTTAGSSCYLSYWTPAGNPSTASGLGAKTANGQGVCSWTWQISGNTTPGNGTLGVTVNGTTQTMIIVILK